MRTVSQKWSNLGFTGSAPFHLQRMKISLHIHQLTEYKAWNEVQQLAQERLDTDTEGCMDP